MPELVLYRRGENLINYTLTEQMTRIGRGAHNDVNLLDEENISRFHALILSKEDGFWLRNLTHIPLSINDEKKVQETKLRDGDFFVIGSWKLYFRQEAQSTSQTLISSNTHEGTLPMDDPNESSQDSAVLQYKLDELTHKLLVGKHPVDIGKNESNNVVLSQPYISGFHARIFWQKGKYFIRDLDSKNGIWVNGNKVIEAELTDDSKIHVGKQLFNFTFKDNSKKASVYPGSFNMVSKDEAMEKMFRFIGRLANSDATVLISGESGTGKELVARALHEASDRSDQPFVTVNCGAFAEHLVQSELFGHEKGAFTGAHARHHGVFEQAGKGTVFLDEIGELPLDLQANLLRVLEVGTVKRLGGDQDIQTHARVIAATHVDIQGAVRSGNFREDLAYRIAVMQVDIPALRERKVDIPILADFFIKQFEGENRSCHLSSEALIKMKAYGWPGNVRELKNTIQRALLSAEGDTIEADDLHFRSFSTLASRKRNAPNKAPNASDPGSAFDLEDNEKQNILDALRATGSNITEAAKLLGIGRSSMYSKLKRYDIDHRNL